MKYTLDRSAVQLVLCQHIKDMDDEELEAAFKAATGSSIEEGHDDEAAGWYCWYADHPLSALIEDQDDLRLWLDHMRDVCQKRLKTVRRVG